MIPDMTDHRAAPVEPSDINTFLPDCGQVRQGDLQWFPLAVARAVSASLAEVTDASPLCKLTHRNAVTWKTGNSGFREIHSLRRKVCVLFASCLMLFWSQFENAWWVLGFLFLRFFWTYCRFSFGNICWEDLNMRRLFNSHHCNATVEILWVSSLSKHGLWQTENTQINRKNNK